MHNFAILLQIELKLCQKKLTTEEFIEKANKVHNCKYDYSKSKYVSSQTVL